MRETYRSLYGDLTKLKDPSLLDGPTGAGVDDALFSLLVAVSAAVDGYCGRHFYAALATRAFDGTGTSTLALPDLARIDTLASDEDADGVAETAWAAGATQPVPLEADPSAHWGGPYAGLRATPWGGLTRFAEGPGRYAVTGLWGYGLLTEQASTLTVSAGAGEATLTVADGTAVAVGQTLALSEEQVLVTGVSGSVLTVARGLNGTVPAAHDSGASVRVVRWPAAVERATLINAARIWTRAPAFEPFYVDAGLDTDVRELLEPYRLVLGQPHP